MILCFLKNDSDYCEGNGQCRASRVKRERRQKVRITVEVNALGDLNQMEAVLPCPSPHGPLNDATTESQHAMLCYYHMCATYTRRQAVRSMRLCLNSCSWLHHAMCSYSVHVTARMTTVACNPERRHHCGRQKPKILYLVHYP